jgi:hypothetical protein
MTFQLYYNKLLGDYGICTAGHFCLSLSVTAAFPKIKETNDEATLHFPVNAYLFTA